MMHQKDYVFLDSYSEFVAALAGTCLVFIKQFKQSFHWWRNHIDIVMHFDGLLALI